MPPKLPPTDEEKKKRVREEGKKGTIIVPLYQGIEIGKEALEQIWSLIAFQIYKKWEGINEETCYYGYSPLFAPLKMSEDVPVYTMRVTKGDSEPVIELFRRNAK